MYLFLKNTGKRRNTKRGLPLNFEPHPFGSKPFVKQKLDWTPSVRLAHLFFGSWANGPPSPALLLPSEPGQIVKLGFPSW